MFLLFTGSDWCVPCINLEQKVLSTQRWQTSTGNLIKHVCDFPITRQLADEEKRENARLANVYNVSGYPTQIILDGDGKEVRRSVGFNGNASVYIRWTLGQ